MGPLSGMLLGGGEESPLVKGSLREAGTSDLSVCGPQAVP